MKYLLSETNFRVSVLTLNFTQQVLIKFYESKQAETANFGETVGK